MDSDIKISVLKADCLCEDDLPHSEEHASQLPKLTMPTLHLQVASMPSRNRNEQRTRRLLDDTHIARGDDLILKEKFEKRAQELLDELKNASESEKTEIGWNNLPAKDSSQINIQLDRLSLQIAHERNQIHALKKELNLYRKLVRQEVGSDMPLEKLLTSNNWKGRAEEIEQLKKEIADMEAKAYGHKYLKNPLCFPEYQPRFPRVDDLISPRQVECLRKEAMKRKEKENAFDKEISSFMREYSDLALMYKASVTHNQSLADELRLLKQQQKICEHKAKDDLNLIRKLVNHQMQVKELLDTEDHLSHLVNQKQKSVSDSAKNDEMDISKYKTLWETSEYKKQSILEMLQLLTDRLDNVIGRTEEAYNHVEKNLRQQQDLEEYVEKLKSELKSELKPKTPKSKAKRKIRKKAGENQTRQKVELETLLEENEFLKNFLHSEIELKEKDIQLYMLTMNTIRKQYLDALAKMKEKKEDSTSALPEKTPKN